jgi:hypothetical protein
MGGNEVVGDIFKKLIPELIITLFNKINFHTCLPRKKRTISTHDYALLNSFKERGIVKLWNKHEFNKLSNMVKKAKRSIKIIVYYGDGILNGLKAEITEAMSRNKKVEVRLLFAGNVTVLKEVMELETNRKKRKYILILGKKGIKKEKNKKEETLCTKYSYVKEIINEIEKNKTNRRSRLIIKGYNTQVRYAVTIIDDKWAWWTPYHPGIITEKSPSFELVKKGKDSFLNLCNTHFDRLWLRGEMVTWL